MKIFQSFIAVGVVILLSGCFDADKYDIKIFFDDETKGRVAITYYGVDSTESDPAKIQTDVDEFVDIIRNKNNTFFEGYQPKDGRVWIEADKINVEINGTFIASELFKKLEIEKKNDDLILVVSAKDNLQTNGKEFKAENNRIVVWNVKERYLELSCVSEAREKRNAQFLSSIRNHLKSDNVKLNYAAQ